MFLTLDLLPSEIIQIYNMGKATVALGCACLAHSSSELLTLLDGWLCHLLGSHHL